MTRIHRNGDLWTRFWSRVDERGQDECWPWTGTKNNRGYGWIAGIVLGLVVVIFAYWLLEKRAERKREEEAKAARLAFEKQARFSVTINHLGARHELIFDGTEPSRLAVLDLALRRNPLMGRQ